MSNTSEKTKNMVITAMFIALIIVMSFVPGLGYIPLGFMNATIIHIPVIIGAIVLGPKTGALLGFAFGLSSMIHNTLSPNLTSFVFSPFYSVGENSGNLWSVVISIVPRVMIGLVAYLVYSAVNKSGKQNLALALAGLAGSMTNTILVMGGIYVFFGESYAAAKGLGYEALFGVIMGVVATNGIPEAIVAALLTVPLCRVLFKVSKAGR